MLNCQQVTEMAGEYLDKTLPWHQRLKIGLHLFMCRHCQRFFQQFHLTGTLLQQMTTPIISQEEASAMARTILQKNP